MRRSGITLGPLKALATSARRVAAFALVLVLAAMLTADPAGLRSETLPGPIPAEVLDVVDGDTLLVRARIWIGQEVRIRVRLFGIDAPELKSRCATEKEMAERAKALLRSRVASGGVTLRDVRYGKFAGRVVARVSNSAGEDLGQALLDAGLARAYAGGRREPWCAA